MMQACTLQMWSCDGGISWNQISQLVTNYGHVRQNICSMVPTNLLRSNAGCILQVYALAGNDVAQLLSVQQQFIGDAVSYNLARCEMVCGLNLAIHVRVVLSSIICSWHLFSLNSDCGTSQIDRWLGSLCVGYEEKVNPCDGSVKIG